MLERDLYEPVRDYLDLVFSDKLKPLYGEMRKISAITATSGGNNTGIWSKPDLCVVALTRQKYGFDWRLDLHGFEVKPAGRCTAEYVHEALNHTAFVHFTHLIWHCERWDDFDDDCAELLDRCAHFGVGLITFSKPKNPKSYVIRVRPRRHSPDPDLIDEFIETRLEQDRARLQDWIKGVRR
jgi:hypothetical protein